MLYIFYYKTKPIQATLLCLEPKFGSSISAQRLFLPKGAVSEGAKASCALSSISFT